MSEPAKALANNRLQTLRERRMTAETPSSDIEIYIKTPVCEPILAWLEQRLDATIPTPDTLLGKKVIRLTISYSETELPVTIMIQPIKGFCTLQIDSDASPWTSDLAFARAFSTDTGLTVRCGDGLWQEGGDPDAWIEISPQGERQFNWKD